jgi:hypothetical protein
LRKITGNRHKRAKQAAAEVMGAVLLIGATLAVGFAVWAYARGAASNAEKNFGSAINSNINCLKLGFVVVNVNFTSVPAYDKEVTLWLYSTAPSAMNITSITLSNSTSGNWTATFPVSSSHTLCSAIQGYGNICPSDVKPITINSGTLFSPNKMYTFQAEAQSSPLGCAVYTSQYNQITPNTSPV